MRDTALKRVPIVIALGLAVALPFVATAVDNASFTTLATRMILAAVAAPSLNLILGYGGMVSFGHAAYYGFGGYVVGILYAQFAAKTPLFSLIPGTEQMLITVPAAIVGSGFLALVLGALSLRTAGVQFIMITLAFAQMLFVFFVGLKTYGGDDGLIIRRRNALPMLDTRDDTTFYFVCLALLVATLYLVGRLVRSRFGMVLGGIRQSERRMAAIGISAFPYKLTAFVIAGMGAGLAGALMANFTRFASPDMLHWTQSGELMVMVILGGTGRLFGPVLGAAFLIGLETVFSAYTEHWQLVLGLVLLLVVLLAPGGLSAMLLPAKGDDRG